MRNCWEQPTQEEVNRVCLILERRKDDPTILDENREFNRAWNLFCTCLTILACTVVIRLGWMIGNWICSIGKVPQ